MRTLHLDSPEPNLDFNHAMKLATSAAKATLEDPVLLSWYDRDRNIESPAHASECHVNCDMPGYVVFASNRGGELTVDIEKGRFVFCYRPLGEFGPA